MNRQWLPDRRRNAPERSARPASHFASEAELDALYQAALRRRRELLGLDWSSIEALMFALRERGTAALSEPAVRQRLGDLNSKQMEDVLSRLLRVRSRYPAIDDELLCALAEQL